MPTWVLFWTGTVSTLIDLPSPPSALALLAADESAVEGATACGSPFGAPSQPQPCWFWAWLVAAALPLCALPLSAPASPPSLTAVVWLLFEACWSPWPRVLTWVLFWTGRVRTLIDLPSPPSALALLSAEDSAEEG